MMNRIYFEEGLQKTIDDYLENTYGIENVLWDISFDELGEPYVYLVSLDYQDDIDDVPDSPVHNDGDGRTNASYNKNLDDYLTELIKDYNTNGSPYTPTTFPIFRFTN